jgi:hypothetical protein
MEKKIRLNESDLEMLVKKIIKENLNIDPIFFLEILEDIFEVNIIIESIIYISVT